ncbi:site-2 protease family protein [Cellulomonas sp. ATA003]|uniref:site-2 protease family protein n=1 Tax=Cellulomonas sp. ATA003 TaxID=3073064 RepID=UPI002873A026|nr:site-2 protease family protein [Cellulomonas sp. ATA003]WNB86846.1 site-2 protease family protein [Cellulomonas sp. ATA003]
MQQPSNGPRRGSRPQGTAGWVIGHAAGAPIILARSWIVAAVVLTVIFAPTVRGFGFGLSEAATYAVSLTFVVLLFASVFLHELAHGFVARANGLRVHEFAITLWGGHTSFAGGGATARVSALIAVVGPLTNIALAVLAWAAVQAVGSTGLLVALLYSAAFANAFVGVFNLVPGLPLDGGRVLEALVWGVTGNRYRGTVVAGWAGRVVAIGLVLWTIALPLARGGQPSLFTVLWAVLIAGFLWTGATAALTGAAAQRSVEGLSAARLGRPAVVVPLGSTLADAQRAALAAGVVHVVVLARDGRPAAYVDPGAAATVPVEAYSTTDVLSVAVPIPVGAVVDAGTTGEDLAHEVNRVAPMSPVMALVDAGRVTALLFTSDVVAALGARS